MKELIVRLFMWKRSATRDRLMTEYLVAYFLTRSTWRSYVLLWTGSLTREAL